MFSSTSATSQHLSLLCQLSFAEQQREKSSLLCADIKELQNRLKSARSKQAQLNAQLQRLYQEADDAEERQELRGELEDQEQPNQLRLEHTLWRSCGLCWLTECSEKRVRAAFKPYRSRPADRWTLKLMFSTDGSICGSACRLPPSIQLARLITQCPHRSSLSILLHEVAAGVASFAERRHQLSELISITPASCPPVWHDTTLQDIRPGFRLSSTDGVAVNIILQLSYLTNSRRPISARVHSEEPAGQLRTEDHQELEHESLPLFLRMSLADAFQQAFA